MQSNHSHPLRRAAAGGEHGRVDALREVEVEEVGLALVVGAAADVAVAVGGVQDL